MPGLLNYGPATDTQGGEGAVDQQGEQAVDPRDVQLKGLIAQGATDKQLDTFMQTGEVPTGDFGYDEKVRDAELRKLIAQGATDEELDTFMQNTANGEIVPFDANGDAPSFLHLLPEELRTDAARVYQQQGKPGVINMLSKLAAEDERLEETLNEIPWLGGIAGFDQEDKKNFGDAWDNLELTIAQSYPNLNLTTSRLARSLFSEDAVDSFVDENGRNSWLAKRVSREGQQEALDAIDILKVQHKDTGAIIGNIKNGDIAGALSGILASPLNLLSTVISTAKTGGAGLFTDMFAETYLAVNEIRAENLGISVDELVDSGQDSVAAPAAFSAVMTALEFAGMKGVGKHILENAGKLGIKRLTNWFIANNKEGMTELAQFGLGEAANEWERSGGDVASTAGKFMSSLLTEDAWENYATGFFSGGVVSGPKAIFGRATSDRTNLEELDGISDKIADLEDILRSDPSLTDEQVESLSGSIKILKEEGKALADQPYRALVNLRDEDVAKLEESETQLATLREQAAKVEADTSLDDSAKQIQTEAINKKIEENQVHTQSVVNESNQRVIAEETAVLDGIKQADKLNKQQEKINEKEQSLKDQETQLAAADNPNPTGTKKIAQARKKLAEEQKQLDIDSNLVPEASKTALDGAENVDQATKITTEEFAFNLERRQRNPIDTLSRRFGILESAEIGEPDVQLGTKREVRIAKEDLGSNVADNNSGTQVDPDTYETTSERKANSIAAEANRRGLRSTVTKAKGSNFVVKIGDPILPGAVTISPTSQISKDDAYVKQVVNKLQKFFGTALDIEIRPVEAGTAFGRVTEENGRIKIIISDGSITKGNVKLDTLFHEPGHVLYQMFEFSKDPKAQAIFKRIEELIVKTPEYKEVQKQEAYNKLSPTGKKQEAFAKYFGRYAVDKTYGTNSLNTVLDRLVKYVKDTFGIDLAASKLSLNDISDILISDLQQGKSTFFDVSEKNVTEAFKAARQDAFLDTFTKSFEDLGSEIDGYNTKIEIAKEAIAKASSEVSTEALQREHNKLVQEQNDLRTAQAVQGSIIDNQTEGTRYGEAAKLDLNKPSKLVGGIAREQQEAERQRVLEDGLYFEKIGDGIQNFVNKIPHNAKYPNRISDTNTKEDLAKALARGLLGNKKDTAQFQEETNGTFANIGTFTQVTNTIAANLDIDYKGETSILEVNYTKAHVGGTVLAHAKTAGLIDIVTVWQDGKTYDFVQVVDQQKLQSFLLGASLIQTPKKSVSNLQSEPMVVSGWKDLATGMEAVSRDTAFLKEEFTKLDENGNLVQQPALDVLNNYNKTALTRNHYTLSVAQKLLEWHESRLQVVTKDTLDENGKKPKDADGRVIYGSSKGDILITDNNLEAWQAEAVDTFLFGEKSELMGGLGKATRYRRMKAATNTFVAWGDKKFYHAHQYAFMGRIFVKSANGSYQATKEELSFQNHAEPKALTESGWESLLVAAADLFGVKKQWFHERVEFSVKELPVWGEIVANPFSQENLPKWINAKDPFLFLMTIEDIINATNYKNPNGTKGPIGYPSNIQTHWDATNSGPMTQALLLQDKEGAKWVNLLGFEKLQDLYKKLAGNKGILTQIDKGVWDGPAIANMKTHATALKGFDASIANAQTLVAKQAAEKGLADYKLKFKKELVAARLTYFKNPELQKVIRNFVKPVSMIKFYSAGPNKMAHTLVAKFSEIAGFDDINFIFAKWFSSAVIKEVKLTMPAEVALMEELSALVEERALNQVGTRVEAKKEADYIDTVSSDTFSEIVAAKENLDVILPIITDNTVITEKTLADESVKTTTKLDLNKTQMFYKVRKALPNLPAAAIEWARKNFEVVVGLDATTGALSETTAETLATLEENAANVASKNLPQVARDELANYIENNQAQYDAALKETLSNGKNNVPITKKTANYKIGPITTKNPDGSTTSRIGFKLGKKEVKFGAYWKKISKLNLGISNKYAAWVFNNPTEFRALKKSLKNLSSNTAEMNTKLIEHQDKIQGLADGLPSTFRNPYTGFPVRIEPRIARTGQPEIKMEDGSTIQPSIVNDEANINSSKAYTSAAPLVTLGNDATLPAILGNNKEIPNTATHDSFGFRAEDAKSGIKAIQDGIIDVYDKPPEQAPLLKIFQELTESDKLGQEAFDRVFKGDLEIKGNVDNNQHNHSAGKGSTTLADFQDTFVNETNATRSNELFGNSKSQTGLETAASFVAGKKKDSWFQDLAGPSDLFGRLVRSIVPPAADDYHGHIQKISKNNPELRAFLYKQITQKYVKGMHAFVDKSHEVHTTFDKHIKQLKKIKIRLEKEAPVTLGKIKINNNQAIIASIATDEGLLAEGASQSEITALKKYVASNKKVASFAKFLKDQQIITPELGIDFAVTDLGVALNKHVNGTLFNEVMAEFKDASKTIFNSRTMNTLRTKFGDKLVVALQDSLDAMSRLNKYNPATPEVASRLNTWLLGSIGVVMFLNVRSAILQTLSIINYATASKRPIAFLLNIGNPGNIARFKELYNGAYLSERRRTAGFDVNANELFRILEEKGPSASIKFILKKGFKFTSVADSFAVAWGGAAFIKTEIDAGVSEADAIAAWKEQTEEAQQSSRPDRISQWQRDPAAKFVLAFANTPQQYFRLSQKALRVMRDPNATLAQKRAALTKVGMYFFLQNIIFTIAQGALTGLFGDDEKEKEEDQEKLVNSWLNSVLRGMGFIGAFIATIINTAQAVDKEVKKEKAGKRADYNRALLKITGLFPPVNKKISQLLKIGTAVQYDRKKKGFESAGATAVAQGGAFLFNLPLDWVQKKGIAVGNLQNQQFEAWQNVLNLAGWSSWDLGVKAPSRKKKSRGRSRGGRSSNRGLRNQRKNR